MADMISKIVFQSSGGDKVAHDIGKIKQAFDGASKSKSAFETAEAGGGSSLPSDAFGRATPPPLNLPVPSPRGSGGGGLSAPSSFPFGQSLKQQHFSRFIQSGVNAVQSGTSDIVQGAGSALGMLGKAGVAGIIAASVAAIGMGASKIAEKDLSRRNDIWSGLGQSLGQGDYESFRAKIKKNEALGYTETTNLLSGIAGAGGNYDEGMVAKANKMQYGLGMNANIYGTLLGQMQKSGIGVSDTVQENMALQAKNAVGRSGMTDFYSTISGALEKAMERGFQKGTGNLTGMYKSMVQNLADYSVYGGLTAEGAKAMFTGVQSTVASPSSGVQTPEDAWRFMMARKSGESYGDTIRTMTGQGYDLNMYEDLKNRAGGDRSALEDMLVKSFSGVTYTNVGSFIESKEKRLSLNAHPTSYSAEDLKGVTAEDIATRERKAADLLKKNMLEGGEQGIGGIVAKTFLGLRNIFTNKTDDSPEALAKRKEEAWQAYGGLKYLKADGSTGNQPTDYRNMTKTQLMSLGWNGSGEDLAVTMETLDVLKQIRDQNTNEAYSDEGETPQ